MNTEPEQNEKVERSANKSISVKSSGNNKENKADNHQSTKPSIAGMEACHVSTLMQFITLFISKE